MSKIDIDIIELFKKPYSGQDYSQLILELKGADINTYVVNCLRRTCYKHIPIYALETSTINIEKNTSIFNDDYMKLRLLQVPLFNLENEIIFLQQKYWYDVNYDDNKREKHPHDDLDLQLHLNVHNNTNNNMNVFSDSIKYYKDNEQIDDLLKKIEPILIISLRPNETFQMKATAVLGVGERSDIWSAVSGSYYTEKTENKFNLTIESQGQIDEYVILLKACKIINKKLDDIKNIIKTNASNFILKPNELITLVLSNEDHTIANILNYKLQHNKHFMFSGLSKPDLLIQEVIIKLIGTTDKPLEPLYDTIDECKQIFSTIEQKILKVGKKYIKQI